MNFIDLFPTVIASHMVDDIPESELISYKSHIQNLRYHKDKEYGEFSHDQDVLKSPIFNNLNNIILNYSKLYLNEIGKIFEDIQISCSWINRLDQSQQIFLHSHANSYISGVFYFQNSTSSIVFQNPNKDSFIFTSKDNLNSPKNHRDSNLFHLTPKKNQLIIFPSYIKHTVEPTKEDNRVSIAFNIIPKGKFGGETSMLYL